MLNRIVFWQTEILIILFKEDVVLVCCLLLHVAIFINSTPSKWSEIVSKLQSVVTKIKSDTYMYQILSTHKSVEDNIKIEALRQLVIHYLSHAAEVPEEHLTLVSSV